MPKIPPPPRLGLKLLPLLVLLPAACVTTESMAPPVPGASQRVEAGRQLYLTCAGSCHLAEPPARYPKEEWPGILADMIAEAEMDPSQEALIADYLSALGVMD